MNLLVPNTCILPLLQFHRYHSSIEVHQKIIVVYSDIVLIKVIGTHNDIVFGVDGAPIQTNIKSDEHIAGSLESHGDIGEVNIVAR